MVWALPPFCIYYTLDYSSDRTERHGNGQVGSTRNDTGSWPELYP